MPSMLDSFPWDILYIIFDYLETIDLLHAFAEINPYLDNILRSYSRIQLNFKSMKKSTFYYICEHVHPDQIQSLVLSDDEHTPGQIKLFMSLLPLIQFTNLQYISIYQIQDANLLCLMLSHLENHIQLQSISIDGNPIMINKRICRSITETLTSIPFLKYLTFLNSSSLITLRQPLSNLTHLIIRSCMLQDLKIIFHWIPNLLHLQILIPFNDSGSTFDYIPPKLNSLIIESKRWMLFNELENFLLLTSSLKRFTLEIVGEQALLDGRRWENLIKTHLPLLTEFALNIIPEENNMTGDDVLIPFQSSFWINEKHWHIACLISTTTQSCARLFSVPHFSPTDEWYPTSEGFFNYSLTPYSFDDDCKELRVSHFPSQVPISTFFKHIQTLSLECDTYNIDQLQKLINLSSVNHLKLRYSVECTSFHHLLKAAPNIHHLTTDYQSLANIINSLPDNENVFKQIKNLHIKGTVCNVHIDDICQMFPQLEYISLFIKKREDILQIFNELHYLITATIYWNSTFHKSLSLMDEYLQQDNICTDGTYYLHTFSLHVWTD